jgi:hypothetical protein
MQLFFIRPLLKKGSDTPQNFFIIKVFWGPGAIFQKSPWLAEAIKKIPNRYCYTLFKWFFLLKYNYEKLK